MTLAVIVLGIFILAIVIAGVICYYRLAVPNRKPLTEYEREICRKLVKEGKAYPFVCKQSVKIGECPCLPCEKLNRAKATNSRLSNKA